MRATSIPAAEVRVKEFLIPHKRIVSYGQKNDYPQVMHRVLSASPTGIACRNLFTRFVKGDSFEDERLSTAVVNLQGQKLGQLFSRLVKDYASYSYFAVHVNYNLLGEPTTYTRINPEYIRLGTPDSFGTVKEVAIYDQWDQRNLTNPDPVEIQYVNLWHPSQERVLSQIELAGGIQNYKGQVYLYMGDDISYPTTFYDSVWQEMLTETEIGAYNYTRLKRGFVGKHIVAYAGELTDDQLKANKKALKKMSGPEGDDIAIIDGFGDGGLNLLEIKHNQTDNMWSDTEAGVRAKIMRAWGQNPILHGDFRPGSLGQSTEIENAFRFYNMTTRDHRLTFTRCFEELFGNWAFGSFENFNINPIEFTDGNAPNVDQA